MKTVLFACVHNAGRSQMAAALFNRYADPEQATGISAGTEPGSRVHPEVLEALKEIDIDVSGAVPRLLSDELASTANVLVTMGCGETCPVVPGIERLDWPLEDPKGRPIARVREIRNEVRDRVRAFLAERGWGRDGENAGNVALVPARKDDEAAVRALLEAAELPVAGIDLAFPEGYVVARADGVIGCAGIEVHDGDGLLRSVAVRGGGRHLGLGSRLVEDRVLAAKSKALRNLYLITTTAAPFFERLGFEPVQRETVPEGIRKSPEFASICPSSAAVLRRSLQS
jgi:arsenate reductase